MTDRRPAPLAERPVAVEQPGNAPAEAQRGVVVAAAEQHVVVTGLVLPPPGFMDGYDPDSRRVILTAAERRTATHDKVVLRGQILSGLLAATCVGGAVACGLSNYAASVWPLVVGAILIANSGLFARRPGADQPQQPQLKSSDAQAAATAPPARRPKKR